jgi:uncharacterized membrane protein
MRVLIQSASSFAVLATGLLAGVMLGVALEQQTAQALSGDYWTIRQNLNDHLFRLVMPIAFVITVASACWALFVQHGSARRWMVGAIFASLAVVFITIVFEVPLNDTIAQWRPGQLPNDWTLSRDAWLRNHWWRTSFGVLAFLCSAMASRLENR